MFNHVLKSADQMFGESLVLPINTTVQCPTALNAAGHGGSLAVTVTAVEPVTLGAAKAVSITVQDSDDGVTFVDVYTATATSALAKKVPVGGVVARMPLPDDTRRWVKVKLGTTDAAAVGKVDVFLEYLAR